MDRPGAHARSAGGHGAEHTDHDHHTGHDKHAGHSVSMFRDRFWLSLALSVPTLAWSPSLQAWLGFAAPDFPFSAYVPAVFGTAVFVYGGLVFLRGGATELRDRLPGMMTLISLAIGVAFIYSLAVTVGWKGEPLWWELATLVTIMLLGHWIEMRSIRQAQGALNELARLLPDTAERVTAEGTEEVPVSTLSPGDTVLVRPGAAVPADGVVKEGRGSVNESMLTGESNPVPKEPGSSVAAGTVNGSGSLRIEVKGTGDETTLAGIMRLVQQAQTSRSRAQALADRAAFFLTLVAIGAGATTLIVWLVVSGDPAFAIQRLVTVLVIACPHALGLAVPLVVAISTTLGARNGLLVRDRRGLEGARDLDAVVFDKTGTLTTGEFGVVGLSAAEAVSEDDALRLAAGVEQDSEHMLARGIVAEAGRRGLPVPAADGFEAIPGHGVRARVEGRDLLLGGPALLRRVGAEPADDLRTAAAESERKGHTTVYLLEGTHVIAVFALADRVREESRAAVEALHGLGIEVVMLTGDARAVAEAVAEELGIDTVYAEVLPDQKAIRSARFRRRGSASQWSATV